MPMQPIIPDHCPCPVLTSRLGCCITCCRLTSVEVIAAEPAAQQSMPGAATVCAHARVSARGGGNSVRLGRRGGGDITCWRREPV
jgi:hypothetical protein